MNKYRIKTTYQNSVDSKSVIKTFSPQVSKPVTGFFGWFARKISGNKVAYGNWQGIIYKLNNEPLKYEEHDKFGLAFNTEKKAQEAICEYASERATFNVPEVQLPLPTYKSYIPEMKTSNSPEKPKRKQLPKPTPRTISEGFSDNPSKI